MTWKESTVGAAAFNLGTRARATDRAVCRGGDVAATPPRPAVGRAGAPSHLHARGNVVTSEGMLPRDKAVYDGGPRARAWSAGSDSGQEDWSMQAGIP